MRKGLNEDFRIDIEGMLRAQEETALLVARIHEKQNPSVTLAKDSAKIMGVQYTLNDDGVKIYVPLPRGVTSEDMVIEVADEQLRFFEGADEQLRVSPIGLYIGLPEKLALNKMQVEYRKRLLRTDVCEIWLPWDWESIRAQIATDY